MKRLSKILDFDNIETENYAKENEELFKVLLQHSNSPSQISKTWRKGLVAIDKTLLVPPINEERSKRLDETFVASEYKPVRPNVRKVIIGDIGEVFKDVPLPNLQLAHRLKRFRYPPRDDIPPLSRISDLYGKKISILKRDVMENASRMDKMKALKNYSKRKLIFKEILYTERTYLSSLKSFMTKYIVNMGNYIPGELMDEISENVRLVIRVNSPLLRDLEKAISGGYGPALHQNILDDLSSLDDIHPKDLYEPRGVPDLFITKNQEFKAYSKYANFYSQALKDINKLMDSNEEFRKFTFKVQKELKAKRSRSTTIRSFLIMPIQRIPRYKLLWQDLLKRSSDLEKTRPQFLEKIRLAKSLMDDTATFLNKRKKEFENRLIVVDLMRKFTKLKFLLKEELKYKSHVSIQGIDDAESVTVYVFTKHVVIQIRRIRGGKVKENIQSVSSSDPHVRVYLDKETSRTLILELEDEQLLIIPGSKAEAEKLHEYIYEMLKVNLEGTGLKSYSNAFERPIFLGWLKKESEGIKSRYLKKRFFVVTADMKLKYYDNVPMEGGKFRKGFSIVGAKVGLSLKKHYKSGFFVKVKKRCYFLKAETDQERDIWVGLLCNDLNCESVESYKDVK